MARIKKSRAVSDTICKADTSTPHNVKINRYCSKNTRYRAPEIRMSFTNNLLGIACTDVNKKIYLEKKDAFESLFAKNGIAK
jgi:hypothetical protein